MKKLLMILAIGFLATGCSKKEDAPQAQTPHVAGTWAGSGTDDAIGYFDLSADLTQSGGSASGTFVMAGSVATINGNLALAIGPAGGNNVQSLALTRTTWTVADPKNAGRVCAATMTVRPGTTFMTNAAVSFMYTMTDCQGGTWTGGANMKKIAGTN